MLHGTPGGYDLALAVAGLFAGSGLRVIAPSRSGYLRTPLSVGRTPAEQGDAALALLEHLGTEKAAVAGVSGGGMAAVQLLTALGGHGLPQHQSGDAVRVTQRQ